MRKIFLDTETTGLSPDHGDRIAEIAAIAYDDNNQRIGADAGGEYHQYINPERAMPAEAFQVHGLSDDFLADKPVFAAVAEEFIEFIRGGELIIHNAEFDCKFLSAELKRIGKPPVEDIAAAVTCSLKWSRENNYELAQHNLDALCRHYGISLQARSDYHSAIVDTRLLGEVYFRMRQKQGVMEIKAPPLAIRAGGAAGAVIRRQASAEEEAAHRRLLDSMEADTGVTPLYKRAL